ncbi:FtsX-like permease family protein [Bacillus sp. N9]
MRMLIAKDDQQLAIMKSIGFSYNELRMQMIVKALLVLGIGVLLGTILSNTLGQSLVSALLSFIGASNIKFVIDPVKALLICPLMLVSGVVLATFITIAPIKKSSIVHMKE